MSFCKAVAGFVACTALGAGVAEAQVSRVFVGVSGNDANTCSNVATPCRTIGGGIAQVDTDGEVIVIESGSYAGGSITKAVKVNVAAGVVAFSGQPITVNATGTVVIRGITLKAVTPGAGTGITVSSGNLILENSVIDGWNDGISFQTVAGKLFVSDCTFRNMVNIGIAADAADMVMTVENSRFFNNSFGARIIANGALGRVVGCVLSGGLSTALVIWAGATLEVKRTDVFRNGYGFVFNGEGTLRISDVSIVGSVFAGIYAPGGGTVYSYGNNEIRNATNFNGIALTAASLQ